MPRFNEFRRQYGLKQLTSFNDFVDRRPAVDPKERAEQERLIRILREVYGQHKCDASKVITAAQVNDDGTPNGHEVEVSPLKQVLLRTIPELKPELDHVVNAFDPWARDRGEYYSLQWKLRSGAESDVAFKGQNGSSKTP